MHFFTEPTIPSQDSISAIPYGPLSGFEETDFVTGSQFNFASLTKAFACQEGMMFIQQSLFSDCVNVILKPINPLDIEFTPVKYCVYRGLLKDSFLNGTSIRAKATSESEFINDFWDNWEQYKTNTGKSGLPAPTPQSIGYDVSLSGTINAEDIFNNSSADIGAVFVKEGDWIGNFGDIFTSINKSNDLAKLCNGFEMIRRFLFYKQRFDEINTSNKSYKRLELCIFSVN